ncbi:MAG: L-histidine N(alpha)-methyltransferase, partial [Proteobacteria bacterium]|nr:L-histidine N(alpha)-methyltransferase [Pseudomonadota bacterium]
MSRSNVVGSVRDLSPGIETFRTDVLDGLSRPQKSIPSKYFYDATGSQLFQDITELDEYYPTRTELDLLTAAAAELANLFGPGARLIEFGAGSLQKIRVLLKAMLSPEAFVPIDISKEHLVESAMALEREFPDIEIRPVVADFTTDLEPKLLGGAAGQKRIAFFPGSTIGNFSPAEAEAFIGRVARLVGPGGGFLVGVDLKKDGEVLRDAYNDAQGVTAAFNRNLLVRINRELGGDFEPEQFRHHALYNEDEGRVEMHLVSSRPQTVELGNTVI